jgi:hypothetical protein
MTFGSHSSATHLTGVDLSACGRFIASGADDRTAYVYDVRSGGVCARVGPHADAALDVAFVDGGALCTAALDGLIRRFG